MVEIVTQDIGIISMNQNSYNIHIYHIMVDVEEYMDAVSIQLSIAPFHLIRGMVGEDAEEIHAFIEHIERDIIVEDKLFSSDSYI